ncbi:MAG: hypothetical protein KAT65_02705, partial [Methanophagales archaeon]|nr:hypothetical protein [Methanophagales archaeon]
FSGHGFVDGYGNGYIAPYDMLKQEPLVCGIDMQELTRVFLDSVNKSCVLMILDCCYSGIPTKGDRSIADVKVPYDSLFEKIDEEKKSKGKFILASSGEHEVSREKKDCIHAYRSGEQGHCHGVFTYYLIEGLDGKAADPTGIITLDRLHKYVYDQLVDIDKKQEPKISTAYAMPLSDIKIALTPFISKKFIQKKLKEITEKFNRYKEVPLDLICTVENIVEVLKIDSENNKALNLKEEINQVLHNWETSISNWWGNNRYGVRKKIKVQSVTHETHDVVSRALDSFVDKLSFDKIKTLDDLTKDLFENFCDVSKGVITKEVFIQRCLLYAIPLSTSKPTTDQINVIQGGPYGR